MVFKLEAPTEEQFEFQMPGQKKVHKLPLMEDLPMSIRGKLSTAVIVAKRAQKLAKRGREYELTNEDLEIMTQAQTALLDMYAPGVSDKITNSQFQELMQAWNEASSVELGESSAS